MFILIAQHQCFVSASCDFANIVKQLSVVCLLFVFIFFVFYVLSYDHGAVIKILIKAYLYIIVTIILTVKSLRCSDKNVILLILIVFHVTIYTGINESKLVISICMINIAFYNELKIIVIDKDLLGLEMLMYFSKVLVVCWVQIIGKVSSDSVFDRLNEINQCVRILRL